MQIFFFLSLVLSCSILVAGVPSISKTIVVDQNGHGDFKSVQDAVNSIADGNKNWILIHVKEGNYWEKVLIPATKPFIVLEGEGASKSVISYNDYASVAAVHFMASPASDTIDCATFKVKASDFVARDIGFTNTYRSSNKGYSRPAVAAFVGGDRNSFYRCSFIAYQDTVCDYVGRHYFNNCLIEGAIDFIFGHGQSIYEDSFLRSTGSGWLTAHAKRKQSDPTGFVFKNCNITAVDRTYLGRPWNPYATVVFYKTSMPSTINPSGWEAWHGNTNTAQTMFAEAECSGPGSNTDKRVKWEKKLTPQQLDSFVSNNFIGPDDWMNNHP